MAESMPNLLEMILRQCATAAPEPWYPSAYARSNGVSRDSLDDPLNRLRQGGLIQIVDWVKDKGQGYILTPAGQQTLQSPRDVERLKNGQVPQRKPEPDAQPPAGAASAFERGEAVREALLNAERPVVTQVLLTLNVLVFLAGWLLAQEYGGGAAASGFLFSGGGEDVIRDVNRALQETGGLSGFLLLRGQWWRLLTTCFVHAGLIHLAVNMYALFALGPRAEQLWGRWRFLTLYLLSGLAGSTGAMLNSPGPVVGASGALCGLFAGEAVWLYVNRAHLPPALVSAWARSLFLNTLLIAVVVPMMFQRVSNAAHFGGAAGGLATAALLYTGQFGGRRARWLAAMGLVGLAMTCLGLVLWNMDTNWRPYRQKVEIKDLYDLYGNVIDSGWNSFLEVKPLILHRSPETRTPEEVAKAVGPVKAARLEVEAALSSLAEERPYHIDAVEDARRHCRELLVSLAELCRLAERSLEDRENWTENKAAVLHQEQDTEKKLDAFTNELQQLAK